MMQEGSAFSEMRGPVAPNSGSSAPGGAGSRNQQAASPQQSTKSPAAGVRPVSAETNGASAEKTLTGIYLDEILKEVIAAGGTDLHLQAGSPPVARIRGQLTPLNYHCPNEKIVRELIQETLNDEQTRRWDEQKEIDFAYVAHDNSSRWRGNAFFCDKGVGVALRYIPTTIPTIEGLSLPRAAREILSRKRGLVLVTGPTGSGKSTTLAAMIGEINRSRSERIFTIEDPIEYVHEDVKSIVTQRQVGTHTRSFSQALRAVLREDPDVILVGEMRDLETMQLAVTAAETGHLVFATLHTNSAAESIDRIVNAFPSGEQQQIRLQLSNSIEAVFAQQLLKTADDKGRVAAVEVMLATPAIRNLIRESKTHQILSSIQTSGGLGMQTLDQALMALYQNGRITRETAEKYAVDRKPFEARPGGLSPAPRRV